VENEQFARRCAELEELLLRQVSSNATFERESSGDGDVRDALVTCLQVNRV
jgi:hypothetical protein